MNTAPLSENCRQSFELRTHVCFGISPFNSYFSEERIRALALWGRKEFSAMHFFVPDVPSSYTLEALGYSPEKAAWKARRQCQYLHNKIHRALKDAGISDAEACKMVLNWETLSINGRFNALYDEVQKRFSEDSNFQSQCIEASRWVLERRVPEGQDLTQEMLKSAVRYLLTEIPLFLDTAGIVGKAASVFCYHQRVQFLDDLFNRKLPIQPSIGQGFVVVKADDLQIPLIQPALAQSIEAYQAPLAP
jgi:cyclo(L-tyrosyl-L-tyrosyl) synthase